MWEVAVAVILVGTIFFFLNLVKNFDEDHVALKLLFLFGSFWLMIVGLSLTIEFAEWHNAATPIINGLTLFYRVGLWITILTTGYMFVYWIAKLLLKFGAIADKKSKWDKPFHFIGK